MFSSSKGRVLPTEEVRHKKVVIHMRSNKWWKKHSEPGMESYEHRFQGHCHRMISEKLPSEDLSVEKEAPIWGQVLGREKPKCKGSETPSGNWEKSAMLLGFPGGASDKEPAWQCKLDKRDAGLIPGSVRSPGGGYGNSLQYSCLENPMERGPWWAMAHWVASSRTWLKRLNTAQVMLL